MAKPKLQGTCFVIMPFSEELHYFYLYVAKYLKEKHGLKCERADEEVEPRPFLDKIRDFIRNADVIIADCSGNNPNVLYELGIAHALGKPIILITRNSPNEAPSDIRHYEFIHYRLDKHLEFLARLDNALQNILFGRYERLYERARIIYQQFKQDTGIAVTMTRHETFIAQMRAVESSQDLPDLENGIAVASLVLPKIVRNSDDKAIMKEINAWLLEKLQSSQETKVNC